MILFAAQMASLTVSGAASGAAARPCTIVASVPGTVGCESDAPVSAPVSEPVAAGGTVGSSNAIPPGPSAAMAVGAALNASVNSTQMIIRDLPRTTSSLS